MHSLGFRVSSSLQGCKGASEPPPESQNTSARGSLRSGLTWAELRRSSEWNNWLDQRLLWRGQGLTTSEDCVCSSVAVFVHVPSPLLAAVVLTEPSGVDQCRPDSGCHVGNGCCLYVTQGLWFVGYLSTTQIHTKSCYKSSAASTPFSSTPAESL